jgi:hypothetical protein
MSVDGQTPCLCPTILSQPQNQTVSIGGEATFLVDVAGTEPLAYQWQKDGMSIPGAMDPLLSILDVSLADAGAYTAHSSNACGAAVSDPAYLTVIDQFEGELVASRANIGAASGGGASGHPIDASVAIPEPESFGQLFLFAAGVLLRWRFSLARRAMRRQCASFYVGASTAPGGV